MVYELSMPGISRGGEKMKKSILVAGLCVFIGVCGMLFLNGNLFAQNQAGAGKSEDVIAQQRKAAEEKARRILKSKGWSVYVTPESGKGKTEADIITFTEEGKVSSKNLFAQGYGDSNFRLTVQDDGIAVWETMKVDKDKNFAFLRGELRGNEMTGSIFMKSASGVGSTYYYGTTQAQVPVSSEETPVKKGKKRK